MENKSKSSIIIIILLVMVIVGLVGYICYDKGVFGKKESESNNTENFDKIEENEESKTNEKENSINYSYRLARDSSDTNIISIYKINNGNEELIANYKTAFKGTGDIGMYNNKLYINKSDKIVYFDFEKTNPQEETWIEIPQENATLGGRYLMYEKIIDNKLYFWTSDNNITEKYRGILAIDMNATDFSEFKNIYSTDIAKYEYDENNKYIYFTKSYTDDTAYQFDLSTNDVKQIEHNFNN